MRRVVVTGMGMVTPLGCGVEPTWERLIAGQSGAVPIDRFDVSDLPARVAFQLPAGDSADGLFNADQWMDPKDQRKVDDFIIYGMAAARQALDDANWHPQSYEDQTRTGVMIGSGIGGIGGIYEASVTLIEKGPRRVSPFFIPGRIINMASGTALKGVPGALHYVASKGAIISLTRSLARELGKDNITVNAIAPGLTLSDGVIQRGGLDQDRLEAQRRTRAIPRDEKPEDLVGAAAFLASDEAGFMTGQTLAVDGGSAML